MTDVLMLAMVGDSGDVVSGDAVSVAAVGGSRDVIGAADAVDDVEGVVETSRGSLPSVFLTRSFSKAAMSASARSM